MKTRILLFATVLFSAVGMAQNNFAPAVDNPFGLGGQATNGSHPHFVDLDSDGDFDILSSPASANAFQYFENTGSTTSPSYAAPVNNPFGLTGAAGGGSISSGDINGDGLVDIISGSFNGFHIIYLNSGTPSTPSFSAQIDPYNLPTGGPQNTPEWVDLDNDGDLDILTGQFNGTWDYFENIGTTTAPNYGPLQNNPLGLINDGNRNNAFFVDMDGDNDLDLFTGRSNSSILYYENTGTASAPSFPARIANPFGLVDSSTSTVPTLTDLDGDGDEDLLLGVSGTVFKYFENTLFNNTCNVNIPDANLKTNLIANGSLNTNGDSEIQCSEAANYTGIIQVINQNVSDPTGLEAFINATVINLSSNNITAIDVSTNTALVDLILFNNPMTSITLGNLPNLDYLFCGDCQLNSLDLSQIPALTTLDLTNNTFTTIDLTNLPALESLIMFGNQLSGTINLTNNAMHDLVDLNGNQLTNVTFAPNATIRDLRLNDNQITSLDLSQLQVLEDAYLQNNLLSALDVTANNMLDLLRVEGNANITTLNVSQNTSLTVLFASNTALTTIDVSQNPALSSLSLFNTNISMLDLSNNSNLFSVNVFGTPNLTSLDIRNGNNSQIITNSFDALNTPNLTCISVDDVAYANANWTNIDAGDTFSTNCAAGGTNSAPNAVCQAFTVQLDANGDATIVAANVDGGSNDSDGTIASMSIDITAFDCSNVGANTVTLTITDDDGDSSTCSATVTVQDMIAPEIGSVSDITVDNDSGVCGAQISQLFAVTDNCSFTFTNDGPAGGNFPIGSTLVTLTATDPSGNMDVETYTVTVNDVEAPVIVNPGDFTVNADAGACSFTVVTNPTIIFSDNCSATLTSDAPVDNTYPVGTTTVTLTATDPSGNVTMEAFNVTVIDPEAPVITCPADETVMVAQGAQFTLPDYIADGDAVAMDNCAFTTTQTPAAGTMLSAGTYTIEFEVEDASGNATACDFELIVDEILGTNDQAITNFTLFPNPATTQITIKGDFDIASVEVYNVVGQKVLTSTVEMLNIQDLSSGMYLVQITDNEGNKATKRFIKK